MLKVYYDEPCHDQWSHGADAMRYACQGIKTFGTAMNSMTPERLQQLKNNAGLGPKPRGNNPGFGPMPPFVGR